MKKETNENDDELFDIVNQMILDQEIFDHKYFLNKLNIIYDAMKYKDDAIIVEILKTNISNELIKLMEERNE